MSAPDASPRPTAGSGPTLAASAQATLDGAADTCAGAPDPASASAAASGVVLEPGVMLGGHYRLERRLGAGGMGEAWEATHVVINKRVALKVLSPVDDEGDNRDRGERMLREAKIVASIEHPNIVQIVDFGSTPEGAPFLVMDLVRGVSLRELCRADAPLAWPRARGLLLQIADALGASHEQGVIHRDVKPDNVLVTVRGGEEVAKVIDFGIAKSTTLEGEARRLTRTGAICGTPAFMSPEQIRGDPVDPRTDVYSLGCVAYELLVGRRPFEGDTAHELIYAHLFRTVDVVPGELPRAMVDVVLRCLQKDPADRFTTMAELQQALMAVDGSVMATAVADHVPVPVPGSKAGVITPARADRSLPVLRPSMDTRPSTDGTPPPSIGRTVGIVAVVTTVVALVGIGLVRPQPSGHDDPAPAEAAGGAAAVVDGPGAARPLEGAAGRERGVGVVATDAATGTGSDEGTTSPDAEGTATGATGSSETGDAEPVDATSPPPRRSKGTRRSKPKAGPEVDRPPTPETKVKRPPERRPDGTFDLFPD